MRDLTTLDGLLAEHAERAALLDAAISVTDSLQGKPGHSEAFKDQFAATDLLDQTVLRICAYRPRNRDEQISKAMALYKLMGSDNGLTRAETCALIDSMIDGGANV